jgi:crotonobetainyl-CoA:carnitine CoA-transferase CaiB-like acyl-CoA transferase
MSRTPGSVWRSGPRIGEDTCEVLKNELKLTQVEIDALERNGTVRLSEPSPGKITTPNQH